MPESAVWSSVWDRNFGGPIPTVQGLRQGCVFLRVLGGLEAGRVLLGLCRFLCGHREVRSQLLPSCKHT